MIPAFAGMTHSEPLAGKISSSARYLECLDLSRFWWGKDTTLQLTISLSSTFAKAMVDKCRQRLNENSSNTNPPDKPFDYFDSAQYKCAQDEGRGAKF
jgi:hypothetical protein